MNNIAGLAVFAAGIVLLILGFNDSQTIGSSVSQALASDSRHFSVGMVAGGGAAVVGGLLLAVRSRRG